MNFRISERTRATVGLALAIGPLASYAVAQVVVECISLHWVNISQINVVGGCAGWTECPGLILCKAPGSFQTNRGVRPATVNCIDYVDGTFSGGRCVDGIDAGSSMSVTRQVDKCITECGGSEIAD